LPVDLEDENPVKPAQFSLSQNYPNPFNPNTVISYKLKVKSDVKLFIYDALGRVIKVLAKGSQAVGSYHVNYDATGLATGIYYYRLHAGNFVQTKKMLLLR
ncbi:MAG: T9SS type A sorting domain-containing protein, partial [Calditrichaeota bacterium]|nr:T9SS type A sorting domain-containing protein [Calditrichota bacterium]